MILDDGGDGGDGDGGDGVVTVLNDRKKTLCEKDLVTKADDVSIVRWHKS